MVKQNNKIPKVSIIVPVFNVKDYIRECLDSLLNQKLKDIEIICGDGGSSDGTLEILKEYEKKDKRIKVISKKGSGYGQSVNEGIAIAKGEYIGIVESDDKVGKNMYKTLYHYAKDYDLDWIRSDIYFYYSRKKGLRKLYRESITYNQNFYNQVLNPQEDIRPFRTTLHTWAGIYKKEFLKKHKIKHSETPGGSFQDVGFYLKTLYYATRVCFIKKAFYKWRQDNENSSIHYDPQKLIDKSFNEWELNKQYLLKNKKTTDRMWASYNFRRYYSYLWTIEMAGELKNQATAFAKKELRQAYQENKVSQEFFSETEWSKFLEFIK